MRSNVIRHPHTHAHPPRARCAIWKPLRALACTRRNGCNLRGCGRIVPVCLEDLGSDVMVMKSAERLDAAVRQVRGVHGISRYARLSVIDR